MADQSLALSTSLSKQAPLSRRAVCQCSDKPIHSELLLAHLIQAFFLLICLTQTSLSQLSSTIHPSKVNKIISLRLKQKAVQKATNLACVCQQIPSRTRTWRKWSVSWTPKRCREFTGRETSFCTWRKKTPTFSLTLSPGPKWWPCVLQRPFLPQDMAFWLMLAKNRSSTMRQDGLFRSGTDLLPAKTPESTRQLPKSLNKKQGSLSLRNKPRFAVKCTSKM